MVWKEFLSKLSLGDKSPIIHQTTNWRLDNAVEATYFIKNTFPCYDFPLHVLLVIPITHLFLSHRTIPITMDY